MKVFFWIATALGIIGCLWFSPISPRIEERNKAYDELSSPRPFSQQSIKK